MGIDGGGVRQRRKKKNISYRGFSFEMPAGKKGDTGLEWELTSKDVPRQWKWNLTLFYPQVFAAYPQAITLSRPACVS
jgi:hypothetical protein